MKLVILESPYAGKTISEIEYNVQYARQCMLDSLKRGEAPMVSHLLYTQCLDDTIPEERNLGIEAGLAFKKIVNKTVVYTDLGISKGMEYGIKSDIDNNR